mgnify:FL=1
MTVRVAKFTDIPDLAKMLGEARNLSRYKDTEVKVDVQHTKDMLAGCMQRHDGRGEGATWVLVSTDEEKLTGVIVGMACRIQEIMVQLYVTDILFYMAPDAPASDAYRMIRGVVDWGGNLTKVFEFTFGATDVISDYERTAVMFRRLGMEQRGVIYGVPK